MGRNCIAVTYVVKITSTQGRSELGQDFRDLLCDASNKRTVQSILRRKP